MSSNDNEVLVDSLIFQANEGISVNNQDPIENLYNAIRFAETGHLEEEEKWIRTQAKGTGSSAYGPVQINKAALTGPGYEDVGFSPEVDKWIQEKYIPQMDLFLKYGGEDMEEGMERYDYGGKGDFTPEDTLMYNLMSKDLMDFEYKRAGGDLDKFIESWRGVSEKEDPEYYEKVKSKFSKKDEINTKETPYNKIIDFFISPYAP
tara:strand:+ start:52 stop:666 length:615 start_codon:yes stop_codon:yes gene_type:complete